MSCLVLSICVKQSSLLRKKFLLAGPFLLNGAELINGLENSIHRVLATLNGCTANMNIYFTFLYIKTDDSGSSMIVDERGKKRRNFIDSIAINDKVIDGQIHLCHID